MADEVLVEHDNGVVIITINRPEVKNAVNQAVSFGVCEAIDEMERRPDLRLAILTGAGGNFCSGMDLKAFARGEQYRVPGRGLLGMAFTPPKKPVIAAVEGYALAGGFETLLVCDLLIASRTAMFGLPEAKRGLAAAAGGMVRAPRFLPQRIAMELILTGDLISAERLDKYGFINALVEPGEALETAKVMARKIIQNAPMSVDLGKRVLVEQRDWTLENMFEKQDEILGHILKSNDAKEGAKAFIERRPAVWTGT